MNRRMSISQGRVVGSTAERIAVDVLARLLPGRIRDRQRAEWSADLWVLADEPASARGRYLLGAAWTIPALWAVSRPGRRTAGTPTGGLVRLSRLVEVGSWVWLAIMVALVGYWLVHGVGPYLLHDIPGRLAANGGVPIDPMSVWPNRWMPLSFVVFQIVYLVFGWAYGVFGATSVLLGLLRRRAAVGLRVMLVLLGAASLAVVAVSRTPFGQALHIWLAD